MSPAADGYRLRARFGLVAGVGPIAAARRPARPRKARASAVLQHGCGLRPWAAPPCREGGRVRSRSTQAPGTASMLSTAPKTTPPSVEKGLPISTFSPTISNIGPPWIITHWVESRAGPFQELRWVLGGNGDCPAQVKIKTGRCTTLHQRLLALPGFESLPAEAGNHDSVALLTPCRPWPEPAQRVPWANASAAAPWTGATGTALASQISPAYSRTVRSMENRPMPATLRIDQRAQSPGRA